VKERVRDEHGKTVKQYLGRIRELEKNAARAVEKLVEVREEWNRTQSLVRLMEGGPVAVEEFNTSRGLKEGYSFGTAIGVTKLTD
jgi:hypothetical protein